MTILTSIFLGGVVINLMAIGLKLREAQSIKASASPASSSPVDIAFVFYGGSGAATQARVDAAATYFETGKAQTLGFVGGCRPAKGQYGSRDMANEAISQNVPETSIVIGEGSYDSRTNIERVQAIYEGGGYETIAFISDPLHLPRLENLSRPLQPKLWAADYGGSRFTPFWRAQYEVIVDVLRASLGEARYATYVKNRRLDLTAIPDKALCNIETEKPSIPDQPREPRP